MRHIVEIIQPFVFLSVHNQLAKEDVMHINQIHTKKADCLLYSFFRGSTVQGPKVQFFRTDNLAPVNQVWGQIASKQ